MAITDSIRTRLIAARAVQSVLNQQMPLEQALAVQDGFDGLDARDRAFARLIAATTFRRLGQIDAALKAHLRKPPPLDVHCALRTATAQIVFLDTPAHAAVGETVDVVRAMKKDGFANLVNAVLRKVVATGKRDAQRLPPKANIPGWLRGSWEKAYGAQSVRRTAAQLGKSPPLDLSTASDPEGWAGRLGGTLLPTGTVRLSDVGDVTALEGFADGQWWAQDIAASLPVKMMDVSPGMRVLDLCAAPGGKTLQLAALGAQVTSVDISEARLRRLRENIERTGLQADIVVADALEWEPDATFDAVLLDAPCTATGTLRRHPDVLYNKTPKSLSQLVKLQRRLLARAADWVKPGGQLLYAVCSLQPEEGHPQVTRLLGERPDFRLNPNLTTTVSKLPEGLIVEGCLRSMPHHLGDQGGMDGFFAARLERIAG